MSNNYKRRNIKLFQELDEKGYIFLKDLKESTMQIDHLDDLIMYICDDLMDNYYCDKNKKHLYSTLYKKWKDSILSSGCYIPYIIRDFINDHFNDLQEYSNMVINIESFKDDSGNEFYIGKFYYEN